MFHSTVKWALHVQVLQPCCSERKMLAMFALQAGSPVFARLQEAEVVGVIAVHIQPAIRLPPALYRFASVHAQSPADC